MPLSWAWAQLGRRAHERTAKRFVPIGYPTESQRASGATGGAIGVHGPRRSFAWAGGWNATVDWTRGCVAVATDEAITKIAAWVARHPGAPIHIG